MTTLERSTKIKKDRLKNHIMCQFSLATQTILIQRTILTQQTTPTLQTTLQIQLPHQRKCITITTEQVVSNPPRIVNNNQESLWYISNKFRI